MGFGFHPSDITGMVTGLSLVDGMLEHKSSLTSQCGLVSTACPLQSLRYSGLHLFFTSI